MRKVDVILLTLLICNILLVGYFFVFNYKTPATMCLNNPLQYGYAKIQEANKYPLQCSCTLLADAPSPILRFNSTSTWMDKSLLPKSEAWQFNSTLFNEILQSP